jgi:RNA polymerase sigma-70 factor (ECF subfamily)
VHDVFVELARSRDRLARITDLDAYIFTMLRHAVSRRRRRRDVDRRAIDTVGRQRADAGRFTTQPVETPDNELTSAVARLPPAQREVLSLKIDGGLTFVEIAAVIGTSINTAASRYRYAIENIRATLTHPESAR